MQSQSLTLTPNPNPTPTPTPATYTTIPISVTDVVSRSIQNLTTTLSLLRPWPEFLSSTSFARPGSASDSLSRIQKNSVYFRINYALIVVACAALSLLAAPISLLTFAVVLFAWVVFYFSREDPIIVSGRVLSDKVVLLGLILVSLLWVWFTGCVQNLVFGSGFGLVVCGVHGVFRDTDGLVLDEREVGESSGMIGSSTGFGSGSGPGYGTNKW